MKDNRTMKEMIFAGTKRKLGLNRLTKRLRNIRMVLLDNDGVLTDGSIIFGADGPQYRQFDVKDGFGIKLLQNVGLRVGIISGLRSGALESRAKALGIDDLYMDVEDKLEIYEKIKKKHDLQDMQIAFIGDDLLDLPIMIRCGLGVAVADAHTDVKKIAHLITRASGGRGAVREFIDCLLKAQGHWKSIVSRFYT